MPRAMMTDTEVFIYRPSTSDSHRVLVQDMTLAVLNNAMWHEFVPLLKSIQAKEGMGEFFNSVYNYGYRLTMGPLGSIQSILGTVWKGLIDLSPSDIPSTGHLMSFLQNHQLISRSVRVESRLCPFAVI